MDWWLFSFLMGAILSLFLPIVPALFYVILFLVLASALFYFQNTRPFSGLFFGLFWLFFAGLNYNNTLNINGLNEYVTMSKPLQVQAKILSLVDENSNKKINLLINKINNKTIPTKFIARVTWQQPKIQLSQGNYVELNIKIKPAHGFANAGGFSYQTWLRQKSIVATGYVVKKLPARLLYTQSTYRQQLYNRLVTIIPNSEMKSIILALALGERSAISQQQWSTLTATGTQHLIAISGLHLGLVASTLFILITWLIGKFPITMIKPSMISSSFFQSFNSRYIALGMSLLGALIYANLAGFSLPTQRALLMMTLFGVSKIFSLSLSKTRWFLLTVVLSIMMNPMAIISVSFWLSFTAVLFIFMLLWRFSIIIAQQKGWRHWLLVFLIIQTGISLLLMPVSAWSFQRLSLAAFFANLVAVPWISFVAMPLIFVSLALVPINQSWATFVFTLVDKVLAVLWQFLDYLANKTWALHSLSPWQIFLVSLAVLLLVSTIFFGRCRLSIVVFSCVSLLLSIIVNRVMVQTENWQVSILDVGNGSAMVVERNGHAFLYDTGAKFPSGFSIANSVILPYLTFRNIKALDFIMLSHDDNDHAGGIQDLLADIKVPDVFANFTVPMRPNTRLKNCIRGQNWQWQGLTIHVLWPKEPKGVHNDDSCVIQISDGKQSILFTGDISSKIEKKLLALNPDLTTQVFIVPHHGSKSSSSWEFLQHLHPEWAIFSSGYLNQWHMPSTQVSDRFQQLQINTLNTAYEGMITVEFTADELHVSSYRQQLWPYWFAN